MAAQPKFLKNLLYSSANVYTEYLLGLLVSIVIARSLGPDQFGIYALIIWISGLSITVVNAGINVAAIKFTAELTGRGQDDAVPQLQSYLSTVQLIKAMLFVGVFSLIAFLAPGILVEEGQELLLWLIIPAVLFKSYHMFQVGVVKGLQAFHALARMAFIVAPLNVLFVTIAYLVQPTVFGYLVAFVLTSITYYVASQSSLNRIQAVRPPIWSTDIAADLKARVVKLLGYTSLIIIFAYVVFGQSELLFLKHLGSASDLAFFSVGFVLARSATALVPGVYNNILLPRISYAVGKDAQSATVALMSATRHMFYLSLLCAVPLAVFAHDIVLFLYGAEYERAYLPTMIFALVAVFAGVRDTTNAYLVSADQQPLILKVIFVLFCGTLLLDYFLILEFGLLGAVFAYAIIEVCATVAISVLAFRQLGCWPDLHRSLRALAAAAVTAVIAYGIGLALSFTGGFIIGGLVCPPLLLLLMFWCDAFEYEDMSALQKIVAKRTDPFCRYIDAALTKRLSRSKPIVEGPAAEEQD